MKTIVVALLTLTAVIATTIPGGILIGNPTSLVIAATPSFSNFTLNQPGDKVAWVFQAPDAVAVTSLMFRYGARTGNPVEHRISLQGVSTSTGNPDGNAVATAHFTPPADGTWDGLIQVINLTHDGSGGTQTSYTLTPGTFYAMVVEPCQNGVAPCTGAAVPDGSNNSSFTYAVTQISMIGRASVPYAVTNDNGTQTHSVDTEVFGYRSASQTYGFPLQALTTTQISSGEEQGMEFNIPSTFCSSYKVRGITWCGTAPVTGRSVKVVLYSGTTALQSLIWDTDIIRGSGSFSVTHNLIFAESVLASLNAGTTYRIGISPQNSSTNLGMLQLRFPDAADRTALPWGSWFSYTTRTGCGSPCDATSTSWSSVMTTRPMMGLLIDDITQPQGGGGLQWSFSAH